MAISTAPRQSPPRTWRREESVLAIGLVMIAVQLVWRYDLIRRTYFRQDDFHYIVRGLENSLSWDFLMWVDTGHLSPGRLALSWAAARAGGYNEAFVHAVTIGLQAAAGLALLRLLRTMFGARPAILVPLAFFLLTPMIVPALGWWVAMLLVLPLQVAVPMALHAHVLYLRDGRFRHVLAASAWTLFGLAFYVKAALIPFLLLAVTAFWFTRGPWWSALGRHWRAWLTYGAMLAAYLVVYFVQLYGSVQLNDGKQTPQLPDPGLAAEFAWLLTSRSLIPSALGGPWKWMPVGEDYAMAAPPTGLLYASLAVAAVVVAAGLFYRRRAWAAWLVAALYFVAADIVPILLGRVSMSGSLAGHELRYVADAAVILAIALALVLIPLPEEERPWLRPLPDRGVTGFLAGSLAGAFALGSLWSAEGYGDRSLGATAKSYVETARVALRSVPKGAVIVDQDVPPHIMQPAFFYRYAKASVMLRPVTPPGIRWVQRLDGTLPGALIFDKEGRLRPVDVGGTESTTPAPNTCRKLPPGREVAFPLPASLPQGGWTIRIAYLNGTPGRVSVAFGQAVKEVAADAGLTATFTSLDGRGDQVRLRAVEGSGLCVGKVVVGLPQPARAGTPIPLQPVKP
ncbi:hypothetical protein [Thermoactinospora rubra]|uniref:hypothetical protein n=1 Tax=Thermoactinospora rubra TaxID=1088767 RepID=UPI000A114853|nr:hypothetical protein [Thermoactinospora rubra]